MLCDTNVWLALSISGHVHHATAMGWFDAVTEPASVAFCRATQQSYLRLMTTAAVLGPHDHPPLTNAQAWTGYEALLADDRIISRDGEPAGLVRHWRHLATRGEASPKLWMDAYLAAFAIADHRALVTHDAAFGQFDGLELTLLP